MCKKLRLTEQSLIPSSSGEIDRLSELPDPLRLHILTLLPLKSAIRTGALSSRWRNLWIHRWPNPAPSALDLTADADADADANDFVDNVDRLLLRLRSPLDTLRIAFRPGVGHLPNIKHWLDHATDRGVEVLHLDLSPPPHPPVVSRSLRRGRGRGRHRPPPPPYFCFCSGGAALAHLTLSGLHLASPTSHFKKLTSLEVLILRDVSISDSALRKITADLPLLRVLDLRRCLDLKRVIVPAPRIARFTVVECPKLTELSVRSPLLRSLHFSSGFLSSYSISTLELEDLYMSCGGPGAGLPQSNWLKAFGTLSRVQTLTLCSLSLEYIAVSGGCMVGDLRALENLRELQLLMVVMANCNLMDIYSFFRLYQCPRLEKLFIELPTHMRDASVEIFLEVAEEVPPDDCFRNLRMVKINSFKGHINEMRLVRFILSTASHLESLVIVAPMEHMREEYSKNEVHNYTDMMKSLHMHLSFMTKASANVQIVLSEHDHNQLRPTHDEGYCKV